MRNYPIDLERLHPPLKSVLVIYRSSACFTLRISDGSLPCNLDAIHLDLRAEQEIFYRAMQKFTRRSLPVMPGMGKILDKTPHTLPQPLLILTGEHDLPIILSNAQDWQQREPNARLQVIPNAGHCANMDNPAAFNRLLKTFLASQA